MSVETAGEKPGLKKRNRRDHYVPQSYLRGFIDPLRLNSHQPPWHFDVHQNVWSERGTREIRYRIRATYICLWAAITANLTPLESAICGQQGGRIFGQPAPAAEK